MSDRRRQFDWALLLLCLSFGLLALPIGYAATIPYVDQRSLLSLAFKPPVLLPAVANTVAMVLASRVQGRLDQKLAASLNRAFICHGSLAAIILIARIEYSNQLIALSAVFSVLACAIVVWLKHDAFPPKIAALPGCTVQHRSIPGVIHLSDVNGPIEQYDVVLTPDISTLSPEWTQRISATMVAGVTVRHVADYMEERLGLISVDHFDPGHLPSRGLTSYETGKRVFDLILVVATLPITLPALIAGIAAVFLTMGRPIFFVQSRVGLAGQPFPMLKLRTMRPAPPEEISMATNASNEVRITTAGRILRKYRIDELPQLWNVACGEMSVVGPRPEWTVLSDRYVSDFPTYAYRHLVR
ncbi:sugar transferase, partial [Trichormus variabilis]|uniref:sugar transferase n=1 Tax=Anabaena variabilis TaxID=264691 RepID=UPI0016882C64